MNTCRNLGLVLNYVQLRLFTLDYIQLLLIHLNSYEYLWK